MFSVRPLLFAVAIVGTSASAIAPAYAATITYNITFTATEIETPSGTVPFNPVSGSFTLTLDPLVFSSGTATLNSLGINFAGPASFYNFADSSGNFYIYGYGDLGMAPGTNDFILHITQFSRQSNFWCDFGSMQGTNANFSTLTGTVSVSVAETPLPAALPLFATVLAGGGLIAWRRKRKPAKLAA